MTGPTELNIDLQNSTSTYRRQHRPTELNIEDSESILHPSRQSPWDFQLHAFPPGLALIWGGLRLAQGLAERSCGGQGPGYLSLAH